MLVQVCEVGSSQLPASDVCATCTHPCKITLCRAGSLTCSPVSASHGLTSSAVTRPRLAGSGRDAVMRPWVARAQQLVPFAVFDRQFQTLITCHWRALAPPSWPFYWGQHNHKVAAPAKWPRLARPRLAAPGTNVAAKSRKSGENGERGHLARRGSPPCCGPARGGAGRARARRSPQGPCSAGPPRARRRFARLPWPYEDRRVRIFRSFRSALVNRRARAVSGFGMWPLVGP